MKLGEIIGRVQRQFGDDVEAQITEEDITNWVNDACLEIVTNNRTNQGTESGITPITAGESNYVLPADLYLLRAVRAGGRVLKGTTYEQIVSTHGGLEDVDGNPTAGTPEEYCVYQGNITLYPQPDVTEGTLDILYIKRPDVMTSTMLTLEPDVPIEYHPRIVEYCIAQAAELDDDLGHYQLKMAEFKGNMKELKSNGQQPEGDGVYPSITYVSEW